MFHTMEAYCHGVQKSALPNSYERRISATEDLYVLRKTYKSSRAVISLPEQLVSATEQCSGAIMKVFRSSYESVLEQLLSVSEQLVSIPE